MAGDIERGAVEARLRAYIHPNVPQDGEQERAFGEAVDAQFAYESARGAEELPAGVTALSIGSYSIRREAQTASLLPFGLCSHAWAILYSAGLMQRELPLAKRL